MDTESQQVVREHEPGRRSLFIFFLQLRETLHGGRLYVFSILIVVTWALWLVKAALSRRYQPWTADHTTTASVVIPVVDEPVGLFHEVLDLDWLGMSGYYRRTDQTPSFDRTFGKTLPALAAVSSKPIPLSEVGATESNESQAKKVTWIKDLFAGMRDEPQIVGFSWFDQSVNGNDWRIESSSAATQAFVAGVLDERYGAGTWAPR